MQIVPFFTHYQLVYVNIDIPSFSVISYKAKAAVLQCKTAAFATSKRSYHFLTDLSLQNRSGNLSSICLYIVSADYVILAASRLPKMFIY